MFSLFNGIYDTYLAPTQVNLLVVGAPESGKTALLERLKVTEIPRRPRNGGRGNATVHQRIAAEEIPATLRAALVETGATEGLRSMLRSPSSKASLASVGNSSVSNTPMASVRKSLAVQTPKTRTPIPSNVRTRTGNSLVVTDKKKRYWCPAPERYSRSANDQDEEILDEETEGLLIGGGDGGTATPGKSKSNSQDSIFRDDSFLSIRASPPPKRTRSHSREFDVDTLDLVTDGMETMDWMENGNTNGNNHHSRNGRETSMQSISLDDYHPIKAVTNAALQPAVTPPPPRPFHQEQEQAFGPPLLHSSQEEYDLKPNAKMLPLRLVRPTIGTNLAKIDMYGAKCHIFDVGGKMEGLWERYYNDCDAVIFCWKLGEDPDKPLEEPDSDDDSEAEEEDTNDTIYRKQQDLLNTVRKSISDDVPFLILGHVFGNANSQIVDTMYTTDLLLPRYHNPMTGFCCSSAKTGAGLQSAMEWLIPLAKRQQNERFAAKLELENMLQEQGKSI